MELNSLGLNDLEIVSLYLVNFLLVSNGCEAIECVEKQVSQLQSSSSGLQKTMKWASPGAATASNNVDALKRVISGLEKRLSKTEAKIA